VPDVPGDLERERYLSLETFRRDGRGVRTPVWFAGSGGRLYVFTAGDAGKVKRLARSERARVAACDVRGRVHGPWLDARARVVRDAEVERRGYAALRAKYGLTMRLVDALSWLGGRLRRRLLLEIEL
jgi:PPOX class probable F420-dependent enzyme